MSKHLLSVTAKCVSQIISKCNKNEMLRITVDSGGCNGFSYNYRFDDTLDKEDVVIEENGAKVVVDNISANFLDGAILDYKDEMIRSGFVIDTNPNVDTACSCKISFSMKD